MFARIFYVWFWFGSNRYTVLFRRLVGCGDAFPSKWSLKVEKGDYTVRVHIRHEKRELLDRSDQIPLPLHGTSTGTSAQSCPCFLLSRQALLLIRNDLFRILPIKKPYAYNQSKRRIHRYRYQLSVILFFTLPVQYSKAEN